MAPPLKRQKQQPTITEHGARAPPAEEADAIGGPRAPTSLRVENYAHGSDAALDSWVVLERKEGGAGGAE